MAGYTVVDIGHDVPPEEFVREASLLGATVIAGSSTMTTTLFAQRDVVRCVREFGVPCITVFGGAPCTSEWCDEIGADGYSATASEMVGLMESVTGRGEEGSFEA